MWKSARSCSFGASCGGIASGFCALALGVASANAQPGADQAATVLEEITVTARRRTESLQDAPFAVTAFTAQAIEDAGINRMEDFVALTSNVTLATSQGIGTSFLSIRGLTQVRNGEWICVPVSSLQDRLLCRIQAVDQRLHVRQFSHLFVDWLSAVGWEFRMEVNSALCFVFF